MVIRDEPTRSRVPENARLAVRFPFSDRQVGDCAGGWGEMAQCAIRRTVSQRAAMGPSIGHNIAVSTTEVFFMSRPTLEKSMTRHPHSIRAGETLRTAEAMMEKLKVHHLPVRDGGKLVGVITDSDISFAARVKGNIDTITVEESCVDDPVTVDIDTDLSTALGILLERRVDSILVMEVEGEGEPTLAGIFTLRDAARVLHDQLTVRL